MYRPAPPAKGEKATTRRAIWQFLHHWLGRSAAVLAIANIYYGIIKVGELGAWAWAVYTAILVAIVATAVVKESVDCARRRRKAKDAANDLESHQVETREYELPAVQAAS